MVPVGVPLQGPAEGDVLFVLLAGKADLAAAVLCFPVLGRDLSTDVTRQSSIGLASLGPSQAL